MENDAARGWFFSLFAGVFAALVFFTLRWINFDDPVDSDMWWVVGMIGALAAVAARLASYLAIWRGHSSYGITAGLWTWPIYIVLIYALLAVHSYTTSRSLSGVFDLGSFLGFVLFGSIVVLPSCAAGTLLFLLLCVLKEKYS